MQTSGSRQQTSRPDEGAYSQQQPFYCYECGAPGHIARNCELRRQRTTAQGSAQLPDKGRTYHQRSCAAPIDNSNFESSKVYLPMRIARKRFSALLDTGCEITVIPAKLVGRRQLQHTTRTLIAANGTQIPVSYTHLTLPTKRIV